MRINREKNREKWGGGEGKMGKMRKKGKMGKNGKKRGGGKEKMGKVGKIRENGNSPLLIPRFFSIPSFSVHV